MCACSKFANYFNEIFKIVICENLDPRKFSAIRYVVATEPLLGSHSCHPLQQWFIYGMVTQPGKTRLRILQYCKRPLTVEVEIMQDNHLDDHFMACTHFIPQCCDDTLYTVDRLAEKIYLSHSIKKSVHYVHN